jgi:hypothetical protein
VIPKGELRTEMIALLRQGYSKRRPRTRRADRRGQIPKMTRIDCGLLTYKGVLCQAIWRATTSKVRPTDHKWAPWWRAKHAMALIHLKGDATTKGFGTILQRFEVDQRKLLTDEQVEK